MDAWEAGRHGVLIEDPMCTFSQYLTIICREESAEHGAQMYHSLVLRGKLRTAVQWISERETGGVLQPG